MRGCDPFGGIGAGCGAGIRPWPGLGLALGLGPGPSGRYALQARVGSGARSGKLGRYRGGYCPVPTSDSARAGRFFDEPDEPFHRWPDANAAAQKGQPFRYVIRTEIGGVSGVLVASRRPLGLCAASSDPHPVSRTPNAGESSLPGARFAVDKALGSQRDPPPGRTGSLRRLGRTPRPAWGRKPAHAGLSRRAPRWHGSRGGRRARTCAQVAACGGQITSRFPATVTAPRIAASAFATSRAISARASASGSPWGGSAAINARARSRAASQAPARPALS